MTWVWPVLFLAIVIVVFVGVSQGIKVALRRKAARTEDPDDAHRMRMAAEGRAPDGSRLDGDSTSAGGGAAGVSGS